MLGPIDSISPQRGSTKALFTAGFIGACLLATTPAQAALPPGVIEVPVLKGKSTFGNKFAFDSDGKIVFGITELSSSASFGVLGRAGIARLNTNGALDTTFSNDGFTSLDSTSTIISPFCVSTDSKKQIVAAGTAYDPDSTTPALRNIGEISRLTVTGSADSTFSSDGLIKEPLPSASTMNIADCVHQADDKIITVGQAYDQNGYTTAIVHRYNKDGSRDTSYGNNGALSINLGHLAMVGDADLQADGKLVLTAFGTNQQNTTPGPFKNIVARVTSAGQLDTTFGTAGVVAYTPGGYYSYAQGVSVARSGKILVSGISSEGTTAADLNGVWSTTITRLNSDGSKDTSFSRDGVAKIARGSGHAQIFGRAQNIELANGKIQLAGTTLTPSSSGPSGHDVELIRFTSNGDPDTSYSGDGKLIVDFDQKWNGLSDLHEDAQGRVVISGAYMPSDLSRPYVARFIDDKLDPSFVGNVTTTVPATDTKAPTISSLKLSRRLLTKHGARTKSTLTVAVDESAAIVVSVYKRRTGVLVKGKCVRPSSNGSGSKSACILAKKVKTYKLNGSSKAASQVISGTKMRGGKYKAVVTATDAAGNRSASKAIHFRVTR